MQVAALKTEEQQLETRTKETEQQNELLQQKKTKLEKENSTTVPEEKSFFELFLQTTGIRWDYNCKQNEIRGYVAGKKNIKPFVLDTDEHDSFYTVNYLWDVIELVHED